MLIGEGTKVKESGGEVQYVEYDRKSVLHCLTKNEDRRKRFVVEERHQ
jgi:hypothetical protein